MSRSERVSKSKWPSFMNRLPKHPIEQLQNPVLSVMAFDHQLPIDSRDVELVRTVGDHPAGVVAGRGQMRDVDDLDAADRLLAGVLAAGVVLDRDADHISSTDVFSGPSASRRSLAAQARKLSARS